MDNVINPETMNFNTNRNEKENFGKNTTSEKLGGQTSKRLNESKLT